MGFKRKLRLLILVLMPLFLFTVCGDLEPEMQDTRTVILKMDFDQRSSSRTSSVSAAELSQYNTHLILALPSWENLTSSYKNFYGSFAQGLMNTADKEVSLEIPLNTQMKIFAFLFQENYSMSELFSGTRTVGYYGESQSFSIGTQTNNLSLGITLIQVPGTGTDTGGGTDNTAPTASVTATTITTSGSAVVQSTETGTAYLVNTTVTVSNLASITGAVDNKWNSVAISSAATNTYLTATGLVDGTYKVYAVDAAGNLSSASSNSVTVATTATSYWKLIAKQADSDVQLFSSNDVKKTFLENVDDNSSSTFMSIGNLISGNYADTDGKYKFKLVWGGGTVEDLSIKQIIWTQTSWLTDTTVQGLQEIEEGTSDYVDGTASAFDGLLKSTADCVLDGNQGGWWYHCVGQTRGPWPDASGGIPGPNSKIATSMHLYIWVP